MGITSDDVFEQYAVSRSETVERMTKNMSGFMKEFQHMIGKDMPCMSNHSGKKLYRNVKCKNCEHISHIISDENKAVGDVSFTIEYGKREGDECALLKMQTHTNIDNTPIISVRGVNDIVTVDLYPFEHLTLINYLIESYNIELNKLLEAAYICGHSGYMLFSFKETKKAYRSVLRDLYEHNFVHYKVERGTMYYDTGVGIRNLSSASITFLSGNTKIRLCHNSKHTRITPVSMYDIEAFIFDEHIYSLYITHTLPLEFERVICIYLLIASIADLTKNPLFEKTSDDVVQTLVGVSISKTKLEAFLHRA